MLKVHRWQHDPVEIAYRTGERLLDGEAVEREVILRTLEAHAGNKTAAAEALGISRRSIYNKLAAYGIKTDRP